jgi:hypothetical protein
MSFDEWLAIWEGSGKYELRGNKKGCYCMARHGDRGPYKAGNVSIIPSTQNVSDAYKNLPGKCGGSLRAGTGRGWTKTKSKKHPYIVFYRSKYLGAFATQFEAETAYKGAAQQ